MAEDSGKNAGWKVDTSAWTDMEPILNWQDAVQAGRFRDMNEIMATVIKQWPFEGDPSDAASYAKLAPHEWKEAAKQIGAAITAFFQS